MQVSSSPIEASSMEKAEPLPPLPASSGRPLTLTDLTDDALSHCASFLSLADVSHLATTCKPLRVVAYSDAIWRRLYSERWPFQCISSGAEGVRKKYLDRHTAVSQFKFLDPLRVIWHQESIPFSRILLKKNEAFLAQVLYPKENRLFTLIFEQGFTCNEGSNVQKMRLESPKTAVSHRNTLAGHNARITCMRLFPNSGVSLFRNTRQNEENFLVTSSSDRTIRIWWKGRSYRCYKGHNGPVTTLTDTLLGDCGSKVLASGGEDCTVRIWSVGGKNHPLMATFHGHEKPVSLLSVARHKTSLLLSMSTDSRVRVWDTTTPSSSGSSSCVGMVDFLGAPVGMKCHDTLCYIAAGSSVTAIDIRTMKRVSTAAVHLPKIHSFELLASKWLICTGGEDKALLWDIRKNHAKPKPEPVAELDHGSLVTMLHCDPYKVVTGGPADYYANVWETGTGAIVNQLDCHLPGETENIIGLSAMGVDGSQIITNACVEEPGVLYIRNFSDCSVPLSSTDNNSSSKFWEPQRWSL